MEMSEPINELTGQSSVKNRRQKSWVQEKGTQKPGQQAETV